MGYNFEFDMAVDFFFVVDVIGEIVEFCTLFLIWIFNFRLFGGNMFENKMWFLLDEEANLKCMCKNAVAEVQQSSFLKIEDDGAVGLKDRNAQIQFQDLLAGLSFLEDSGHSDTKIVSIGDENRKIRMSASMLFPLQLETCDKQKGNGSLRLSSPLEKKIIALNFSGVGMDKVNKTLLCDHFDLTEQEQDLAIALFQGVSIAAFAQEQRVSKETIRTRLKMLFEKTNTHRQLDIVRLVQDFVF